MLRGQRWSDRARSLRPAITAIARGQDARVCGMFLLPARCCACLGTIEHIERSKQTRFCLCCHIMEPHGKSLYVDDQHTCPPRIFRTIAFPSTRPVTPAIPITLCTAAIPPKCAACATSTCNIWASRPQPDIKLYTPIQQSRMPALPSRRAIVRKHPMHMAIHDDLVSNQMSCISSGCHDTVHNVASLDSVKFWSPAP